MLDQLLVYIPAREAQVIALMGSVCSVLSLIFGLFRRTTWLSKIFGTVSPADLGRIYRYACIAVRLIQRYHVMRKITVGALFVGLFLLTSGCAASFEESSGKLAFAGARQAADPALCTAISGRARWEQGLAVAGAALTGATGITAWPVESKDGRLGLAIGATVLASGTALALTLWQSDATQYIEAGCAAPKEIS